MTTVDKQKLEADLEEIDRTIVGLMNYSYEAGFYSQALERIPHKSDQWYVIEGLRREAIQKRVYARQDLARLYRNLARELAYLGTIIDNKSGA